MRDPVSKAKVGNDRRRHLALASGLSLSGTYEQLMQIYPYSMHTQSLTLIGIFVEFGEINLCSKKFPYRTSYFFLYVFHMKEVLNLRY